MKKPGRSKPFDQALEAWATRQNESVDGEAEQVFATKYEHALPEARAAKMLAAVTASVTKEAEAKAQIGSFSPVAFSAEIVKSKLKTIVLKLLAERKEMYGYEMMEMIKRLTLDKMQLTEGALFPTLYALEHEGLIMSETVTINKRKRKYYRLSPTGKSGMKEIITDLADLVENMKFLLEAKNKSLNVQHHR